MKYVVKMRFGSHVYGTNTPESDLDYKGVYVPDGRDILLQQTKESISTSTKVNPNAKNQAGDIDVEVFSIQKYLSLLCEGQTVAIDMLFTPQEFWTETNLAWSLMILPNKDKFLHRGYASFAGYCRTQANKYGVKGSRVAAMRAALELFKTLPQRDRMSDHREVILSLLGEHISLTQCRAPNGKMEDHLEVCGRKLPFHTSIKYAVELYQRIFDKYGHRALMAEQNSGVCWKAMMHAVRIADQAKELLLTGNVEFPRPNREELLKIRKGEVPYRVVAERIELGLEEMENASLNSNLRAAPDYEFVEKLIIDMHQAAVRDYQVSLW